MDNWSVPTVNLDLCIGCGLCAIRCPEQVVVMEERIPAFVHLSVHLLWPVRSCLPHGGDCPHICDRLGENRLDRWQVIIPKRYCDRFGCL